MFFEYPDDNKFGQYQFFQRMRTIPLHHDHHPKGDKETCLWCVLNEKSPQQPLKNLFTKILSKREQCLALLEFLFVSSSKVNRFDGLLAHNYKRYMNGKLRQTMLENGVCEFLVKVMEVDYPLEDDLVRNSVHYAMGTILCLV
jgi:hypothetical protein